MNLHDDPGAMFRTALPETPPPPSDLDLDRIVRDGYRARRRHRAMLGGAVTTGVAAVAAVLALTVVGLPGGSPDSDADRGANPPAAGEGPADDLTLSGYPYAPEDQFDGADAFGDGSEAAALHEGAVEHLKPLLDAAGIVLTDDVPLEFNPQQSPGNYGQTWLRSYTTGASNDEGEGDEDVVLRVEALLPGGWTAEPGPVTEQLFPQHVISASGSPWYEDADWTDALETTDLGDGRTLTTVNHECAIEALVTYPNGSGLRASWDMGCGEPSPEYEISMEDFAAALTAMPEVDYDTSELAPVGDVLEVPRGWLYDAGWTDAARADAANSIDAALVELNSVLPGTRLDEGTAGYLGFDDYGAVVHHVYSAMGHLPISTTIDQTTDDIGVDFRYTLPGGWLPGVTDGRGPELVTCQSGFNCETSTDDDGTVWAVERYEHVVEPGAEEEAAGGGFDPYIEHQLEVTRFDPDGWAVSMWVQWQDDAEVSAELLTELLRAVPAPLYDESATPSIPEN